MENPGADDPCGQVDLTLEAKIGLTPLPKIKMTLRTEVPPPKKVGHKTLGGTSKLFMGQKQIIFMVRINLGRRGHPRLVFPIYDVA